MVVSTFSASSGNLALGLLCQFMPELNLGVYGEQLVENWLIQQGWEILYRRWHCRWGELDIVAKGYHAQGGKLSSEILIFVEVKTRSHGNWDLDGRLSITRAKQRKLWTSARLFLTRHPYLAQLPCRLDVALVSCRNKQPDVAQAHLALPNGRQYLVLQDYLVNAIEG